LFLLATIPGLPGHAWDMECWRNWATHNATAGLSNAYSGESSTDYLPLYQYFLWAFGKLMGSPEAIASFVGYTRAGTLLLDFWALFLVHRWIDGRVKYYLLLSIAMLNIAYSYDTVIWGQVDAIFAGLSFAAFYFLWRERLLLSALMMVLALNAKLQAIVFVPLWGLLMLAALHRLGQWRKLLQLLPFMLAVQALILLPFAFGEAGLRRVWQVVVQSGGKLPYLSLNACNLWVWFEKPGQLWGGSDDVPLAAGLTYRQVGLLLFFFASLIAMLPALCYAFRVFTGRPCEPWPRTQVWLNAALLALVFYFFNTEMHERYAHPAFIFLTAYAFFKNRYGLYVLFSIAYFLSLERALLWLKLPNYGTLIFDARFLSALFAVIMVWLAVLLYKGQAARRR
jgi:Gpi18-like mannosyltransferase